MTNSDDTVTILVKATNSPCRVSVRACPHEKGSRFIAAANSRAIYYLYQRAMTSSTAPIGKTPKTKVKRESLPITLAGTEDNTAVLNCRAKNGFVAGLNQNYRPGL
ncbi:hypothetical protein EVAR_84898_1 [Eumeta japonica]|uniref:Uncharacterized protein n=1 Tax=Eumeta variegata TaxID=151549 RepID=A0A4C1YIA5_EUMVA|nr:hypothetical protein EVAR_84898_1 [Eumeta japonica]